MNSIVLDQGSVNCLDTGLCCGDNFTCVCVKGARFPSQSQPNIFPREGNVESQQPGREHVLGRLLLIATCCYRVWHATEREYCVEIIVYIFPPAIWNEPSLLKYICILCIQYAAVINIYFLSGTLIIVVPYYMHWSFVYAFETLLNPEQVVPHIV